MSSSNYQRNKVAIDQFRKELKNMIDDISEIDKRILTRAVNEGLAYAKRNTPVGSHPNPVTFTVRNGKQIGKIVSFSVSTPGVGGFLRSKWVKTPTVKDTGSVRAELSNGADYASYWNYGHRIVTKRGGPTKGFVRGTYVLEKTKNKVQKQMIPLFQKEVEAVQKRHDN